MIRIAGAFAVAGISGLGLRSELSRIFGLDSDSVILASVFALAVGVALGLDRIYRANISPQARVCAKRIVEAVALTIVIASGLAALVAVVRTPPQLEQSEMVSLGFVALFAGAVGFGELTERHRDDPLRLFASVPTIIYVSVNVAAGIGALLLIQEFGVFEKSPAHRTVYEVLLASFGSIAFFRSSLFTARVGDKDIDVGPSTLLKSLLGTSDRMINRSQARDRAGEAEAIMRGVDFNKAKAALPVFCFNLVENVTEEAQARVATSIAKTRGVFPDRDDRPSAQHHPGHLSDA